MTRRWDLPEIRMHETHLTHASEHPTVHSARTYRLNFSGPLKRKV